MDIRGKVTHGGLNPAIESTAVRKVSTQTHARGANATITGWQREQVIHAQSCVLVVGSQFLLRGDVS